MRKEGEGKGGKIFGEKYIYCQEKKNGKGKVGKYEEMENIFICGGEEKWRSKKKKNFVEEKHFNAEEKKNGNGGKYGGAHLSIQICLLRISGTPQGPRCATRCCHWSFDHLVFNISLGNIKTYLGMMA